MVIIAAQTLTAVEPAVTLKPLDGKVRVEIAGQLFTEYVYAGHRKPILFPIFGPTGAGMTRQWPIVQNIPGEAHDHPHHEGLWFSHGDVNGVDFWTNGTAAKPAGTIVQKKIDTDEKDARAAILTQNDWIAPDGKIVCTDTRLLNFSAANGTRIIDFEIVIHASNGDVAFGDTKEGTMALRVPPSLQIKNGDGVTTAAGHVLNSVGERDGKVWGRPAAWVDYSGPIDGKTVGIAMFDDPANLRHPTTWHARDYGLFAANPFGLHEFDKNQPKDAGKYILKAGESLTLRYRFVFHEGDADHATIAKLYETWAGQQLRSKP